MNFILFWLAYCVVMVSIGYCVAKFPIFGVFVLVAYLAYLAYEWCCKMRKAWRRR